LRLKEEVRGAVGFGICDWAKKEDEFVFWRKRIDPIGIFLHE
jgi:hypothetical protein